MDREVLRNEIKYYISPFWAQIVKERLDLALTKDPNAGKGGSYFIRSLYFDDYSFDSYNDKLAGTPERTKYRLRFYNYDDSFILYEKKEKTSSLIKKTSFAVSKKLCENMICGDVEELFLSPVPLLREHYFLTKTKRLKPVVIVDYMRMAWEYPASKVRITLDWQIAGTPFTGEFFHKERGSFPVLEADEIVLEVKFNQFLSPHIKMLLEDVPKTRCAISKYCKCCEIL